jgi:hypothetical protein
MKLNSLFKVMTTKSELKKKLTEQLRSINKGELVDCQELKKLLKDLKMSSEKVKTPKTKNVKVPKERVGNVAAQVLRELTEINKKLDQTGSLNLFEIESRLNELNRVVLPRFGFLNETIKEQFNIAFAKLNELK